MTTYKLTLVGSILRNGKDFIPLALDNTDYKAYLDWIAAGNVPEPADPDPQPNYKELRIAAYPPMADYLDGVVKGDQGQIDSYIAACLAVKAQYPKP